MTRTSSVATFFVANPGHHTAMVKPVVQALAQSGRPCRVLSLCELRGFAPPPRDQFGDRVELVSVVPFQFRKPGAPRTGGGRSSTVKRALRGGLRRVAWSLLSRRIAACIGRDTAVAVLPNDAAYPYDGIAELLHARRVPFVLVQEGVRFQQSGDADAYGRGGAAAIAAWGESSADYFRKQGAPERTIHLTGNPRFDGLDRDEWRKRGAELRAKLGLDDRRVLLYLSNPVEHIGLVASTAEKLALFEQFCAAAAQLADVQVLVKLHASEPAADFARVIGNAPNIRLVEEKQLFGLLGFADAAVVLASTAGMEALLFDLPLGVVELPGGYAFDYVQEGAAIGLGGNLLENLTRLVAGTEPTPAARERYLQKIVAVRSGATARVAELVERCARGVS